MTPEAVAKQIDSIAKDIGTDAIKTGMLFSADIIEAVANKISAYDWKKVVVDPVMIAKGGASLLQQEAKDALIKKLLPLALVITPNIPEAEALTGIRIQTMEDKKTAANKLHDMGVQNVVIKGGHDEHETEAVDVLFNGEEFFTFTSKRFPTKNTHGTGCTFSAAMTAELAKGASVYDAVSVAKQFISAAIENDLRVGNGHGPTNHWAYNQKGVITV